MADRYWIGGTGTWNTTSTTNWSDSSGGSSGFSVPTSADNVFFDANSNVGTGAFTVTLGSAVNCKNFTVSGLDGAMTFANAAQTLNVYGDFSIPATNFTWTFAGGTCVFQLTAGVTSTLTTNGYSVTTNAIISIVGSATGTLQLAGAFSGGGSITLGNGILDLNNFTLTTRQFLSSNTNVRSIYFGSGDIVLNHPTAGSTILNMATATNFTWTGTGGFRRNQSATTTVSFGTTGGTSSNAPNLAIFSGSATLTISTGSYFKNLNFSGSSCAIQGNAATLATVLIFGNLTLSSLGASTAYDLFYPSFFFTQTLDTTGKTLGGFGLNETGITISLARNTTVLSTRQVDLNRGTLDLNGFNLTCGTFAGSGGNPRSISFGSNTITLSSTTAAAVVLSMSQASNFTWTGTGGFVRNQAATATISFGTTGGSTTNAVNLTVNAGSSALTIASSSWFKNLNFTGSTCTVTGNAGGNTTISMAGNLILASGGTYTAVTPSFRSTATITTSGKTLRGMLVSGTGITVTLTDAMLLSLDLSMVNGTLDLAGFNLTMSTLSTSAGTKDITFNGATISVTGSPNAWINATPTNFTTTAGTGTGTISLTAATAKTFNGGGVTYNCTLNQGGAGDLTITGSSTFNNITNTVQPASVLFTAGTTNTFNSFSLSGTSGNLITIGSATAASHTLSKSSGTVSVSYCSISYSSATGGASWQAYTSNGNVDAGNNTGWNFAGAILGYIDELIYASDQSTSTYNGYLSISEQTALQDDSSSIYNAFPYLLEAILIADAASVTYTTYGNLSDSINLSDSSAAIYNTVVSCIDTISISDSAFATHAISVSCDDSISTAESLSVSYIAVGSYVDSISLSDSPTTTYDGIVFSSENTSISDSSHVIGNMSVVAQDSINAVSVDSSRFPWDLIEDSQEAEWIIIKTVPYVD